MRKAKLEELCIGITDGIHNPPKGIAKSEYLMLSSKNVYDDCITYDEPRYLSAEEYEQENKRTNITAGDVLLTIVGTVGRCAVVPQDCGNLVLQRSVSVLKPRKDICASRYLMYALISKRALFESEARGVAQKGIYLKQLSQVEIPIPSLQDQRGIICLLDNVQAIITARKQQIAELDTLVKARFVEMFGDPVSNPKGWPVQNFEDISILITDGEHATPRRSENGIYLLSARNVLNHTLQLDDVDFIDEDEYNRIARRVIPQEGDVLISCSGSIGRCCVVPANMRFQMVRSAALIRFTDAINPIYAEWLITSDELQRQIAQSATQSSQANLFQGKIQKLHGYVPPKALQDEFALFVIQTDKSKAVVQKALDEAQTLFDSLMQQYFG